MKKTNLFRSVAIAFVFLLICGCTTKKALDMGTQRQQNINEDLGRLAPRSSLNMQYRLSLNDVIRIGLENNLEIRINQIIEDIADDKALAEKLNLLPRMDLEIDRSKRNNDEVKGYKNINSGSVTAGNTVSQEQLRKTASLSITWNVLDFGLSYIRGRQAAMQKEIRRMESLRQAQKLALEITTSYWQAVLAEQDLEYVNTLMTEIKTYKEKVDLMVSQKMMDPISTKMIEKKLTDLAITAGKLQGAVSGSRIELCRLMGLNPGTRFSLKYEDFNDYLKMMPDPGRLSAQALEMAALRNRPELFATDFQLKVQQDEAKAALLAMFPGVKFYAGEYYDANTYLANSSWNVVGIGLANNILSLPAKYMEWKADGKTINIVKAQRLMLTSGIIAQVHIALHDYSVKLNQYILYDEAHSISDKLLNMTRQRQAAGTLTETVLTSRMLENIVATLERDKNLVDLMSAYYKLMVTLGLDYSRWTESLSAVAGIYTPAVLDDRGGRDDLFDYSTRDYGRGDPMDFRQNSSNRNAPRDYNRNDNRRSDNRRNDYNRNDYNRNDYNRNQNNRSGATRYRSNQGNPYAFDAPEMDRPEPKQDTGSRASRDSSALDLFESRTPKKESEKVATVKPRQEISLFEYVEEDKKAAPRSLPSFSATPAPASSASQAVKYKDKQIVKYMVKRGDYAFSILRVGGKVSDQQVKSVYLPLFKKLNPNIRNFNRLEVGQVVNVPIPGYINPNVLR